MRYPTTTIMSSVERPFNDAPAWSGGLACRPRRRARLRGSRGALQVESLAAQARICSSLWSELMGEQCDGDEGEPRAAAEQRGHLSLVDWSWPSTISRLR